MPQHLLSLISLAEMCVAGDISVHIICKHASHDLGLSSPRRWKGSLRIDRKRSMVGVWVASVEISTIFLLQIPSSPSHNQSSIISFAYELPTPLEREIL